MVSHGTPRRAACLYIPLHRILQNHKRATNDRTCTTNRGVVYENSRNQCAICFVPPCFCFSASAALFAQQQMGRAAACARPTSNTTMSTTCLNVPCSRVCLQPVQRSTVHKVIRKTRTRRVYQRLWPVSRYRGRELCGVHLVTRGRHPFN